MTFDKIAWTADGRYGRVTRDGKIRAILVYNSGVSYPLVWNSWNRTFTTHIQLWNGQDRSFFKSIYLNSGEARQLLRVSEPK